MSSVVRSVFPSYFTWFCCFRPAAAAIFPFSSTCATILTTLNSLHILTQYFRKNCRRAKITNRRQDDSPQFGRSGGSALVKTIKKRWAELHFAVMLGLLRIPIGHEQGNSGFARLALLKRM